jgi:hypothetical protein
MMIGNLWITRPMIPDIVKLTGAAPVTVYQWIAAGKLPRYVQLFLELALNGDLGRIHKDWEGWNIDMRTGEMVTPLVRRARRRRTGPGSIMAEEIHYQQISAYKIEVKKLREKCAQQTDTIQQMAASGIAASVGDARSVEPSA